MVAKQNGRSYWDLNAGEGKTDEPATEDTLQLRSLEMKADIVANKTLEQLQGLVQILVMLKDSDRLLALLSCTREVFRQADQAMNEGKTITIKDDVDMESWN